jgi:hypothetical protein
MTIRFGSLGAWIKAAPVLGLGVANSGFALGYGIKPAGMVIRQIAHDGAEVPASSNKPQSQF